MKGGFTVIRAGVSIIVTNRTQLKKNQTIRYIYIYIYIHWQEKKVKIACREDLSGCIAGRSLIRVSARWVDFFKGPTLLPTKPRLTQNCLH